MATRQYLLYCDESAKAGRYYSNFYGGAAVAASEREDIERALLARKEALNLFGELKWTKITENYESKYIAFLETYFEFVAAGRIKLRIMFTHNRHRPTGLSDTHRENRYFLLYYQLIKHAFGFRYANPDPSQSIAVAVYLDDMPDTKEKVAAFKQHDSALARTQTYSHTGVTFPIEQMAELNSKDHAILQGLDIVLGAVQFRLNDGHRELPEGATRRGKRTMAKERVYKALNGLVRRLQPNFNIGITTGMPNGPTDRWHQPYRHWVFVPKDHEVDGTIRKRKAPPDPT